MKKNYFVWSPDHDERFGRVEWAFTDARGATLSPLYPGMAADRMPSRLYGVLEGGAVVPHFVYYGGLLLIVSPAVVETLRAHGAAASFAVAPVTLRRGREYDYWWINPLKSVPLLDEERSTFLRSPAGVYRSIQRFVVRDDAADDELLLCHELGQPVFSERLVRVLENAGFDGAIFTPLAEYRTLL